MPERPIVSGVAKRPEPGDPQILSGTDVPGGDPLVMLRSLVEEYARMGFDEGRLVSLFLDPSVLHLVLGPPKPDEYSACNQGPYSVPGCGDLNQDGIPHYLCGFPNVSQGEVRAFSGADHSELWSAAPSELMKESY